MVEKTTVDEVRNRFNMVNHLGLDTWTFKCVCERKWV